MKKMLVLVLVTAAASMLIACGAPAANNSNHTNTANAGNVANTNTNAANTAAKPAAAPASKDALMALEKQGWEAWKTRDVTPMNDLLSDKYVGFGDKGRVNKAYYLESFGKQKCEIKSYSWTDEQMTPIGNDVAVLTFRAAQDYVCDGKKGPADTWSSSVYVREGDKWKNVFYLEQPVAGPKDPTPKAKTGETKGAETKSDALTEQLMAIETKGWDTWKVRDAAGVESVMAKDFIYFGGRGRMNRAESIKNWSEPKCTGLDYTFAEPAAIQLAPDAAVVTYKANVKGTCDGKPVAPTLWVASFDVKEGEAWKNAFYTDVPR